MEWPEAAVYIVMVVGFVIAVALFVRGYSDAVKSNKEFDDPVFTPTNFEWKAETTEITQKTPKRKTKKSKLKKRK